MKLEQYVDLTTAAQMHSAVLSSHLLESANRMWGRSLLSSYNGNQLSGGGTYLTASYRTLGFKSEDFKLGVICKRIQNIFPLYE